MVLHRVLYTCITRSSRLYPEFCFCVGNGYLGPLTNVSGAAPFGPPHEWHVDLEKTVTVEKLGSYPACPESRKKPELRAIRPPHLRTNHTPRQSASGWVALAVTRQGSHGPGRAVE